MQKKTRRIIFTVFASLVSLYLLFWVSVNFFIIPKIVVPKIKEYLATNATGPLKISIKGISFQPLRGFVLKDVKITLSGQKPGSYLLCSRLVDIDLHLAALLWKRVTVHNFKMCGVRLNISRDRQGAWNFASLFNQPEQKEQKKDSETTLVIEKFSIVDGLIDYIDSLKPQKTLQRQFVNVNMVLTQPSDSEYQVQISGGAKIKTQEWLNAQIDYNKSEQVLHATLKLDTEFLNRYSEYYLDDFFKPWSIRGKDLSLAAEFNYSAGTFIAEGSYTIKKGAFSIGDLHILADAAVKHKQKFVKSGSSDNSIEVGVSLNNLSLLSGPRLLLDSGASDLVITREDVSIKRLTGLFRNRPLDVQGKYTFRPSRDLFISGTMGELETDLKMNFLPENRGRLDWKNTIRDSYINIQADISDVSSQVFSAHIDTDMRLEYLPKLLHTDKSKIKGRVIIVGDIQGELDKTAVTQGGLSVTATDFTFLGLEPLNLSTTLDVQSGALAGDIPEISWCDGTLSGKLLFDFDRWGTQVRLDDIDAKKIISDKLKKEDFSGTLNGNISVVAPFNNFDAAQGGGYIKLTDTQLRSAPVVSDAEKSIQTIIKDFITPVFTRVEGNFGIDNRKIVVENAYCSSSTLDLGIAGTYSFDGDADFTVGASFLSGGIVKMIRRIIVPFTMSLDLLANGIQVHITGRAPNYKSETKIQPSAWFKEFFKILNNPNSNKYTLDKLW